MHHDMNHDDEHKHGHHHGPHSYWSSWCSPVGLGIFFVTTALAAAIALYTILNLIGAVMTLSNPTPSYSYPAEIQTPTGTTGAGTGAMMTQ